MSKSRNWEAKVLPDLGGKNAKIRVSGEIDTGADKGKPTLALKVPQGINPTDLLLVASPVNQGDDTPNFQAVSYSQDLGGNHHKYTTVTIIDKSSGDVLATITDIKHVLS